MFLRSLGDLQARGVGTASSADLAVATGLTPATVRRDLASLGSYGTRGVGYDVEVLLGEVRRALGLDRDWPVVIVGVGNLGQALARYRGFGERGFHPVALLDADPAKRGETVAGLTVRPMSDLRRVVRDLRPSIGVVCVPGPEAQGVADALVAAGLRSILNFAPAVLSVPDGVVVRDVDLSLELQVLAFYGRRASASGGPGAS